MPDWFYRPIAQRILFRMPTETARNFALGFMGKLARLPLGPAVIDFLGHMRADPRLKQNLLGIEFPTAVGLGPGLDTHGKALLALARFGVGFIEVGPVVSHATPVAAQIERRQSEEAIWFSALTGGVCAAKIAPHLAEIAPLRIPVILRIGYAAGTSHESAATEARLTIENLACHVHLFALSTMRHAIESKWSLEEWSEQLRFIVGIAHDGLPRRPFSFACQPMPSHRTLIRS